MSPLNLPFTRSLLASLRQSNTLTSVQHLLFSSVRAKLAAENEEPMTMARLSDRTRAMAMAAKLDALA
jgi:hypothetical protein